MRWRKNPICELHAKQWDEEGIVLLNSSSGQTHFVDEPSFIALDLIRERGYLDVDELMSRLEYLYDSPLSKAEVQIFFDSLVNKLDEIGLIEPDASQNC